MKKILIYQDYVDHNNNAHNITAFKKTLPDSDIEFCDADDILNGYLTPEIDLFVIPGGADLYFCEKLNGKPNQLIRKYVETGGTYLGLCGGAYFASKNIEWAKGDDDEICQARELSFFNGTAFGPIYDFIKDKNVQNLWDQTVILKNEDGEASTTLYRAGPYFSEPEDNSTTVLARYAELKNTPPAILLCSVDKGRALLCGPHIERSPELYRKMIYKHNNPHYERQSNILKKYNKGWTANTDIFPKILKIALSK